MAQVVVPARYIMVNRATHTKAIRGKHGHFKGRIRVQGDGDRTKIRQLRTNVDLNRDGKIGPGEHGGEVLGRTPRVPVKASKRARGYVREI